METGALDSQAFNPQAFIDGPAWPGVSILCTTRQGGVSSHPYTSFNLGDHVGDEAQAVTANRGRLLRRVPAAPAWLNQVHGTHVVDAAEILQGSVPQADASFTTQPGRVLAILTADCLPVVIAAADASVVAVAHAGWRGLAAGVLEQTVQAMKSRGAKSLRAWIGPGIGPSAFEVGDEVRAVFVASHARCAAAFVANGKHDARGAPKWLADLPALAALRLELADVASIEQSGLCTVQDADRFFSYRRDGCTGRFATLAWIGDDR